MAARLPCRIFIALSILLLSCLTTVMADEVRWRQYIEAGLKASQRGDYDIAEAGELRVRTVEFSKP